MLTLFLCILTAFNARAAEAPEAPQGLDYKVDANGTYFSTRANYKTGGGSIADLPGGGYFTEFISAFSYIQDLNRRSRAYGGFTYSATESSNGVDTRTNGGFNELLGGGQYWMKLGDYNLIPSADLVYPLARVDRESDDALLGEGALKLKLGGWLTWTTGAWTPFAFLGYEYRDEGRSHAIPYVLGVKWKPAPYYLQAEYRGFERLFDAADTENRNSRDAFLQKVDGGSYRYYAINPSGSEFAAEAGYAFGSITVYGGGAIVVNGSSYADGWSLIVGISYSPSGRLSSESEEYRRSNEPIEDHDRFTPPGDQQFEELDPTKPPPETQRPRPPPRRATPPRSVPRPPSPESEGPTVELRPAPKKKARKKNKVDKMLEETEKGLQGL